MALSTRLPGQHHTPASRAINLFVVLLVAGVLSACGKREDVQLPASSPAEVNATTPAPAATPKPDFRILKGKWLRPDGGYILEIRSVDPSGKLDAAYSNPKPIHVAKAEASQDGQTVKVFIELRDVNYPGSTYDLAYQADTDQFKGIYYQAALQQRFEVVFVRTN